MEDIRPLAEAVLANLQEACLTATAEAHAIVISDYAKGTIGAAFCQWMIAVASDKGIPVVVDPKSSDFARYRGATVITPNLKEAMAVAEDPSQIMPGIAPSALLVTRGEDGMSLLEQGERDTHLHAAVNEVADVTGAGDTVVGVLAVALGAGFSLREAATLANFAAGIAVGHHGTWAVSASELLEAASRL
jgi:D-beta-D-heptose 7-phosphate kinase/D-beta-D-heptose 1-phosphate adenosyltransferase